LNVDLNIDLNLDLNADLNVGLFACLARIAPARVAVILSPSNQSLSAAMA
jgi:hypothetical protein